MARDVTVKATFAGDASSLEKTFANVGSGAKSMASDLSSAEGRTRNFGSALDSAGSAAGASESKFMGVSDVASGLGDLLGIEALGQVSSFGLAFADLSGGFESLQPLIGGAIGKIGALVGITGAQTAATGTATGAQWSLNAALAANPIGAIVLAIGLLVGAFVLAWKHSELFRDIVKGAFEAVKNVAVGAFNWVKENWPYLLGILTGPFGLAAAVIYQNWDTIKKGLVAAGGAIKDAIVWPFRTAFNAIAGLWNSTVGRLSFSVPDWVPGGLGGKGFSMPRLSEFHKGGIVPGPRGAEIPILAQAGETVTPAGGAAGGITIIVQGSLIRESELGDVVHKALLQKQRRTPLRLNS